MISIELYRQDRPTVLVQRSGATNPGAWAMIQEALSRGVVSGSVDQTIVHADVLLAELDVLRELRAIYAESVDLGPTLTTHLKSMAADRRARETAVGGGVELQDLDDLDDELRAAGFVRALKPFQRENLARVLRLPHAADFSVPGAGKTTSALATFAVLRRRGTVDRLMVVAPIAAFEAWKEEAADCFNEPLDLVIFRGPDTFVPSGTDVLVSNYHRVASDYDRIRRFVASARTQVVLDEAHRVKRGPEGVHGRAVLDLAYAASRRDVLTGTPAPQGAHDLVALVKFLYPGQDRQILPRSAYHEALGRDQSVLADTQAAIRSYFVRTPKSALRLPPTTFKVVAHEMPSIQSAIYDALIGRYRGRLSLSDRESARHAPARPHHDVSPRGRDQPDAPQFGIAQRGRSWFLAPAHRTRRRRNRARSARAIRLASKRRGSTRPSRPSSRTQRPRAKRFWFGRISSAIYRRCPATSSNTVRRSSTGESRRSRGRPPKRSREKRSSIVFGTIRTVRCSWPIRRRAERE